MPALSSELTRTSAPEEAMSPNSMVSDDDRDWGSYLKARALVGLGRGEAAEAAVRARFKAKPSAYAWASIVSILAAQSRFESAAGETAGPSTKWCT